MFSKIPKLTFPLFGFKVELSVTILLLIVYFIVITGMAGIILSIALLLSILIHELAHAFTARKFNYTVKEVNINFMGGHASIIPPNLTNRKKSKYDMIITFMGPLSNLLLFAIVAFLFSVLEIDLSQFENIKTLNELSLLTLILSSLALWNLFLPLFNLIPIKPLDGGVILYNLFIYLNFHNYEKSYFLTSTFSSLLCICVLFFLGLYVLSFVIIVGIYLNYLNFKDKMRKDINRSR